jgi:hypothetical protein
MYQKVQKLSLVVITSALLICYSVFVLTDNIVLFKEPIYSLTVTSNNLRKENQCIIEHQIKVNQILVKPALLTGRNLVCSCVYPEPEQCVYTQKLIYSFKE